MKFLADQDIYATTVKFLKELGHDIITASEIGLSQADDLDLLKVSLEQNRIFVTRDRDFGGLVFVHGIETGVIYLRMSFATENSVYQEIKRVLDKYSEKDLINSFIVIEAGRHRYRRLPNPK